MTGPSADDIRAAADELSGQIIATPTLPAPALSGLLGCEVHLSMNSCNIPHHSRRAGRIWP